MNVCVWMHVVLYKCKLNSCCAPIFTLCHGTSSININPTRTGTETHATPSNNYLHYNKLLNAYTSISFASTTSPSSSLAWGQGNGFCERASSSTFLVLLFSCSLSIICSVCVKVPKNFCPHAKIFWHLALRLTATKMEKRQRENFKGFSFLSFTAGKVYVYPYS